MNRCFTKRVPVDYCGAVAAVTSTDAVNTSITNTTSIVFTS